MPGSILFNSFQQPITQVALPTSLHLIGEDGVPHELCVLACNELQHHLESQQLWKHNFGLGSHEEKTVVAKMFGVLVVKNKEGEIGYLAAFSGKLAGGYHHPIFVPAVYDGLVEGSYLNLGMQELNRMNAAYRLIDQSTEAGKHDASILGEKRKNHSSQLQRRIFEDYKFVNVALQEKSLREIFDPIQPPGKNPPAGAGECAGIKLLQYAFLHHLTPLALAEFWWGKDPRNPSWVHGQFYPCCKEKCEPILGFMLG
ncbi:MAG: pseudouridylate synthase [Flavobacteriales bacterium]